MGGRERRGRESGKEIEREKESERERERGGGELVVYRKVSFLCVGFFAYFDSSNEPCAPREKWHRKEDIIIIIMIV